jgi:dihydrofolate reductase
MSLGRTAHVCYTFLLGAYPYWPRSLAGSRSLRFPPPTRAIPWTQSRPRERNTAMAKVVAIMSMSLDGYVADRNDGVADVFDWYFTSGNVGFNTGGSDPMIFKVSEPSAEHLRGLWSELGAVLTGRRTFDVAQGWGGNHAWGPAFVLTHHIPAGWPRPNSTVHFVTDGLASAVNQAKEAAAGKSVGVHGADTIQQLLNAGLLDELHIDIAPVLLGDGVRLFDHLAGTPLVLGNPTVIPGVGVTHLRYPVRKAQS